MPLTFKAKVQADDWFRFNMRHNYTSFSGILSVVVGLLLYVAAFMARERFGTENIVLFFLLDTMFLLYTPIRLKARSKLVTAEGAPLADTYTYTLGEEAIEVEANAAASEEENRAVLPYNLIYKAILTKQGLYIYSSRVNAYIIPRRDIESQVDEICDILRKKLQSYQLNF
jgi:hypothetical protein